MEQKKNTLQKRCDNLDHLRQYVITSEKKKGQLMQNKCVQLKMESLIVFLC